MCSVATKCMPAQDELAIQMQVAASCYKLLALPFPFLQDQRLGLPVGHHITVTAQV